MFKKRKHPETWHGRLLIDMTAKPRIWKRHGNWQCAVINPATRVTTPGMAIGISDSPCEAYLDWKAYMGEATAR